MELSDEENPLITSHRKKTKSSFQSCSEGIKYMVTCGCFRTQLIALSEIPLTKTQVS